MKAAQAVKLGRIPPAMYPLEVVSSLADFFSAAWLKIGLKEAGGGLAPFVYNKIQMDHLAGLRSLNRRKPNVDQFRGVRDLILKPRRLGFSTYVGSLYFMDGFWNPGTHSLVMAHTDSSVAELFDIYKIFYECLPADVKERVVQAKCSMSEMELTFLDDNGKVDIGLRPNSSFKVHTAGGKDKRGATYHNLHLSEAAFYENWSSINRSVVQAVDMGGNIMLESTAKGFNHYKDLVDGCLSGQTGYRLIFYPWFAFEDYRIEIDRGQEERILQTLDKEEQVLRTDHGASLAQLAWRRAKLEGMTLSDFHQEFPSTILEAFLSSGRPAFDQNIVVANWDKAKRAKESGYGTKRDEFVTIYAPPVPGATYTLSADPAEGIDKGEGDPANEVGGEDYSSASIRDNSNLRVMATVHGRMDPPEFARLIANLGVEYNEAMIVVERNNHGHVVLYALDIAQYPNIYRHQEYDASGQSYLKLGFPMTVATRPLVIDALRETIKRDAYPNPDPDFWKECSYFQYGPTGKAEAATSRHDDRVMDSAIGVYASTLGARSWGGEGLLQGADATGLPRAAKPQDALVPAEVAPVASPKATEDVPLPPDPWANPGVPSTAPLVADALGISPTRYDAPQVLTSLNEQRSEAFASHSPKCGNCCHMVERNGGIICRLQGFNVQAKDPACPVWESTEPDDDDSAYQVDMG